jgi:hypothetical protein
MVFPNSLDGLRTLAAKASRGFIEIASFVKVDIPMLKNSCPHQVIPWAKQ